MDPSLVTWLWLGGGALLLLSEFFVPGLIAAFFGMGAITVAGLRLAGVIEGDLASFGVWGVSSAAYVLLLRNALLRMFGPGERSRESTSEEARAFGQEVEVLEAIAEQAPGRIRFEGTSWPAITNGATLPAGSRARLIYRNNLAWVVESVDAQPSALPPVASTKPRLS